MSQTPQKKVDDISQYYVPVKRFENIGKILFWINAILSFTLPYSVSVIGEDKTNILKIAFLILVLGYFFVIQIKTLYLFPKAESMRRKQLLSNSFGVPLSLDKTSSYYNNSFPPSVERLGANTMENALFSREIIKKMLVNKRILTFGYFLIWLLVFAIRHNNYESLISITQVVFSVEIIAEWGRLEILRIRCGDIYEDLYQHFYNKPESSEKAIATLLDAFVAYESAKSEGGIQLSTKIYNQLNDSLSEEWDTIRQKLNMDDNN